MRTPASCNRVFWVLAAAWTVLMATSCEGDGARVALPGKVGAAGELVVVATPGVWEECGGRHAAGHPGAAVSGPASVRAVDGRGASGAGAV